MAVSEKEIMHIANLARLKMSDDEIIKFKEEFNSITQMVDEIASLDLKDSDDKFEVKGTFNVFRDDEIKPSNKRDEILKNAPKKEAGCVVVPRVME